MPARPSGTPCRTARRTGSRALPSLLHVTLSVTSEHLLGLLGSSPIPRSFVTSRVRLQPRPLPSTGITRLLRYLRASPPPQAAQPDSHESPVDPPAITAGASRVASGPRCVHAVAITPAGPMDLFAHTVPSASAFPVIQAGRLLHYPFRGLLSVYSRYGLHAHRVAMRPSPPEASTASLPPLLLRLLPGGANQLPGGTSTRCGPAPFHGALNNAG